jgi:hypothetical protein
MNTPEPTPAKATVRREAGRETSFHDEQVIGQGEWTETTTQGNVGVSVILALPFATPSQNTYQRWHFHQQRKYLETCKLVVRAELNRVGLYGATPPDHKVTLTIRRYSSGRLDRGNFIGGCKPLLDALRHEGVIHDDSETWLEDRYEQHEAKRGEARTEVEIE